MTYSYDHRTKTASIDGPHAWVTDRMIVVWCSGEFYGRIHQVTAPLEHYGKLLDGIRGKLLDSPFRSLEIPYSPSEVYVDGIPGGRNSMKIEFYISRHGGTFTPEEQAVMYDFAKKAGVHSVKKPPGF